MSQVKAQDFYDDYPTLESWNSTLNVFHNAMRSAFSTYETDPCNITEEKLDQAIEKFKLCHAWGRAVLDSFGNATDLTPGSALKRNFEMQPRHINWEINRRHKVGLSV